MLISALRKDAVKVIGSHDPNSKKLMRVIFRPDTWTANHAYEKRYDHDYDAVMPTTYKGLYFRVKYPGMSGSTDPFTGTYRAGDEVTDGTCVWEAVNYNLMPIGVTVSSVTVTATNSVTTSSKVVTTTTCEFFRDPLTVDADEFDLTLRVVYSNTAIEDYTLRITVDDL